MQELKGRGGQVSLRRVSRDWYEIVVAAQKTYNGVAIAARTAITDVRMGLDDGVEDPQARLISAVVDGVRVMCVYVPNGQAVDDKHQYKLQWMDQLVRDLEAHYDRAQPMAICGDFNVAPEDKDVHDPVVWAQETLFHIDARLQPREDSLVGARRPVGLHHWEAGYYSWWDYQMLSFPEEPRPPHRSHLRDRAAPRPSLRRLLHIRSRRPQRPKTLRPRPRHRHLPLTRPRTSASRWTSTSRHAPPARARLRAGGAAAAMHPQ